MNSFHSVADLIDAFANTLEQGGALNSSAKHAAAPARSPDDALAETYQNVFGAPPEPEVLKKLASDPALAETFQKLAERATRPDSLGGPGDQNDSPSEPTSKSERLKAAEDRFANWLTG